MKSNIQLKYSNYVAFSHFHRTTVNNSGLGKKVDKSQKKKESSTFKAKKLIDAVDKSKLIVKAYRANTSNIMTVIGQYLSRK